jgi:hypothetical protein
VDVQWALLHFFMALRIFDAGVSMPRIQRDTRAGPPSCTPCSRPTLPRSRRSFAFSTSWERKSRPANNGTGTLFPGSRGLLPGKLRGRRCFPGVDETRRFRNLALRSYNAFEPARATSAVAAARRLMVSLGPAFGEFKRAVDPAAEDEVASSPTPSRK